jgi:anti-sigma regulatory factor (Ser/Thr protein kinase)
MLGPYGDSPRTARVSARAQLSQWGRGDLAYETEMITSELVTNAVQASEKAGSPVAVRMILTLDSVVVEVLDHAPGYPARRDPGHEEASGRGLNIVADLSLRWGWYPARVGKVVWAEVAVV